MPLISFLFLLFTCGAFHLPVSTRPSDLPIPDHSVWHKELQKYVDHQGQIDYARWQQHQDALDQYLSNKPSLMELSVWGQNVQLAYWINLYNASTIKLVLMHYPISSLKEIYAGDPWSKAWIEIDSNVYSLNQIENEIIRKRFNDSRIHFALNCASRSCPKLLNEAYEPAKLDDQLHHAAISFINDEQFNQLTNAPVRLSQLFEWYASDFGEDIISYLNKYALTPIQPKTKIEYLAYDWKLNSQQ